MAKLLIQAYYYKLFGFQIKEEIYDYLNTAFMDNRKDSQTKNMYHETNLEDLLKEELDEKDKIELELTDDKITRITRLYELNRKLKYSDKNSDALAIFFNNYDSEHTLLLNCAVVLTVLSPFI
jgi:hypothetical protein